MHEANYNTMAPTYGRPGMNKKVVNSYLMTDGSRFTDKANYETMEYYDEMQNRDPRLTQTVVSPGYTRINSDIVESPNFNSSVTGYQIILGIPTRSRMCLIELFKSLCVSVPRSALASAKFKYTSLKRNRM